MKTERLMEQIEQVLKTKQQVALQQASPEQLHDALGEVVMQQIADAWYQSRTAHEHNRRAYYLSAEYLIGRMVHQNLYALGILNETKAAFAQRRKTFLNTVSNTLGIDKNTLREALLQIGVSDTIRGEQLTMEQLATLSDILYK